MKDTSTEAYHKHKKFPTQKERVLAYIKEYGPKTRAEIEEGTGFRINAVCGRVNALLKEGAIRELPKRKCNITGNAAHPVVLNGQKPVQSSLF